MAAELPRPTEGMELLQQLIHDDLQTVNTLILQRVSETRAPLITELAAYIVGSGGKRMRPAMTLATAALCEYDGERHIGLAACVEFIHTATLLHDDVVDESALRRGQPTANAVWSNQSSVLVGDFLFSRAFQLMTDDGSLSVLKLLSSTAATISEGEVHQLGIMHSPETSIDDYMEVIRCKTAALFAAAAQIGAMVSERKQDEQRLYDFGESFGIAFQLVDDALDYMADESELGKTVGDDFREGKVTLPLLLAWQEGDASEKAFLERCLQEEYTPNNDELKQAITLFKRYDTIKQTIELAEGYASGAKENLMHFDASPARNALEEALDFCVSRAY